MASKTEKDFWVEMSIREISTQAHFAGLASRHFEYKAATNTDAVFSSIHSFLSHCTLISKLLKGKYDGDVLARTSESPTRSIGDVLGVHETSIIHERALRNNLEHYDRELKKWIRRFGVDVMVGTYNIGPRSAIGMPNAVFVSHYDPNTQIFTFVNDNFDLRALAIEARRIQGVSDAWVSNFQARVITPPFL